MSSRGTLRDLFVSGQSAYWRQLRGDQDGRYDLLRASPGEKPRSILPRQFSASTSVHEYGGGAFFVDGDVAFFSNSADQRLYRLEDGSAAPITPAPEVKRSQRYADGRGQPGGRWIVCVQEVHHEDGPVLNQLVALPKDGSHPPQVIAHGHDFYSDPRFNAVGDRLLWLTWDHPNMPWDGTELWSAEFTEDGQLSQARKLAGGPEESLFQPQWGTDDVIHFISDRTSWWNLYRWQGEEAEALHSVKADLGTPAWNFGFARYAFLADGRIAYVYTKDGFDKLALLHPETGQIEPMETPFTAYYPAHLCSEGEDTLWFFASSPEEPQAVYKLETQSMKIEKIFQPVSAEIDEAYLADIESIAFPTGNGDQAHAFLYPPKNKDFIGPEGERPPLIVMTHGGPTSAAVPQFHLEKLFFTTRGFLVADINYRGSTGFGREYREKLKGEWGIVDVEDCVNLARYLAKTDRTDPDHQIIRGSSAGGYATLAALTFHDVYDAGASYYGVADIWGLAETTHKFEAHYLDSMIGPYPAAKATYHERSPIHHTEGLNSPLILFQGAEDKVVPPEQSQQMAAALEEKGLPYAYLEFEGESHGFDRQSTIVRALTAELYFYSRVLGFGLQEEIMPIEIHNL
ncbi:MAG: prolyl oligopeptidase family serine peptidase [Anaerolineales bacterium]